jgi:hypothetical protein
MNLLSEQKKKREEGYKLTNSYTAIMKRERNKERWFVDQSRILQNSKEVDTVQRLVSASRIEWVLLNHKTGWTDNSHYKTDKCTNLKIIFLYTIHQNCDMFRSIFIIFRDLLNISKAYTSIKSWMDFLNILYYVKIFYGHILKYTILGL